MIPAIAERRLRRQLLTSAPLAKPEDVVGWFGAVQAQEYEAAKWGLGLRVHDGVAAGDVERAFEQGRILRTHVMRPTWHFVASTDIRWLLELTAASVHRRMAPYNRQLELDSRVLGRTLRVIERALGDGGFLTRGELGERLHRAGLPMTNIRLAHAAMHAELEGIICSGPRRGKQLTYALLAKRAPQARSMPRDEALAALARRFFTAHGPATLRDFSWWSGLAAPEAKRSVDIIKAQREEVDGRVYWTCGRDRRAAPRQHLAHLLPIYDEYLIAYRDRDAVPHGLSTMGATRRFATFQHAVVIDGQVAGTWRPQRTAKRVQVQAALSARLSRTHREALTEAAGRYERFLGTPVTLAVR